MNLRATQALFWRAITWPTGIDDFLAKADEPTRRAFESQFAQTPTFGRRERMQVYAEAYFFRLAEVLHDQYPVTRWLAGPARFHNLATDYVLHRPSRTPDVRRFGDGLTEYVATHPIREHVPGIEEVAAVERSLVAALDAPDRPPLSAASLREVAPDAWPELRFVPGPATHLCPCALPYSDLRARLEAGEASPTDAPKLDAPAPVLVWRCRLHVYQRTPAPDEARALRAALTGEPFSAVCAAAFVDREPDPPQAIAAVTRWLRRWVADEVFAEPSEDPPAMLES